MHAEPNRNEPATSRMRMILRIVDRMRTGGLLIFLIALAPAAFAQGQQQPVQPGPVVPQNPRHSLILPEANRLPDANEEMEMQAQIVKRAKYEAANIERKRQIMEDSARLLKIASEMKAEIDKTNKDTLSLSVIRKAEDIERLAKIVETKMKLTVGSE